MEWTHVNGLMFLMIPARTANNIKYNISLEWSVLKVDGSTQLRMFSAAEIMDNDSNGDYL